MIATYAEKLYGNMVVLVNLPGQERVPYADPERLRAWRDARVRDMVAYAAATVPYYRDFFRQSGVDPREIRTAEDLDLLPLLGKEAVQEAPWQFVSVRQRRPVPLVTSGSTGSPLVVYYDHRALLSNIAHGERERTVLTRFCQRSYALRTVWINHARSTSRKVLDYYDRYSLIPLRPKRVQLDITEPLDRVVDFINAFRPEAIRSCGSYIELLGRLIMSGRVKMRLPRVFVYGADSMSQEGRRSIEERLGVPVLSTYQAVEALKIGYFCEERTGFHLHEDLCHVRIIDEKGATAAPGEKGEVVISNLVNRGTVLLNYRLGDVASLARDRCPCGRSLVMMTDLEGRVEDLLVLPDGRFVHPRAVWGVVSRWEGIVQYQLVQHTLTDFELRLVTADGSAPGRMEDEIRAALRGLLGCSSTVDVRPCSELSRGKDGKFRSVVCLVRREGEA